VEGGRKLPVLDAASAARMRQAAIATAEVPLPDEAPAAVAAGEDG
jgi:hypothetical protein